LLVLKQVNTISGHVMPTSMNHFPMQKKMHVVHVIESLDRGGMETFVCELVKTQQLAFRVSVVCLFSGGVLVDALSKIKIQPLFCEKGRDGTLKAMKHLRKLLVSLQPDVIHTHNELSHYFTLLALTLSKRPYMINTRHNMGLSGPQSRKEKLFRWSLNKTGSMVACSYAVKKRFVDDFGVPENMVQVIHNGIPFDKFRLLDRSVARAQWRKKYGFSDQAVLIASVGRMSPVKNHKGLLDAFAQVQQVNLHLVIVGDGDLRHEIESYAKQLGVSGAVLFVGDSSDVAGILCSVDIFVLASLSEAHSIALLEAAASGLAVVATAVGGNAEVVVDGESGFIVPAGDVNALSKQIRLLVQDSEMRARFGKSLFEWANAHASIESCAKKYEMLYQKNYVE
jgi:glycosyltransferase involved in cell wall biosynthesis